MKGEAFQRISINALEAHPEYKFFFLLNRIYSKWIRSSWL